MVANKCPTVFTDGDIKRWCKKLTKSTYWGCCFDKQIKFEALLYRLARAERLTDFASCKCESLDQCKCGFLKNYVRWKKSSGKARQLPWLLTHSQVIFRNAVGRIVEYKIYVCWAVVGDSKFTVLGYVSLEARRTTNQVPESLAVITLASSCRAAAYAMQ